MNHAAAASVPTLEFLEVPYASPHYHASVALRQHVLRSPLGLTYAPAHLAVDEADRQFVALQDGMVVGCVMLHHAETGVAKLRQFAVAPSLQGQGIGGKLLERFEAAARASGYQRVRLSARRAAERFYLRHGYATEGEPYVQVGLPHIAMTKTL